jgi:hypothetical protein
MDKDLERLENRSKKVREIMAEQPPFYIRYGSLVILLILMTIVVFSYVLLNDS